MLEGKAKIRKQAGDCGATTPGIFNSGYFVLSALDGAPRRARERRRAIDLDKGGQAAQMLVIPRYTFNTPGSTRAQRAAERGRRANSPRTRGLQTGVTGGAAQLIDYSTRHPRRGSRWVIVAITLATFLVLVVVLRALLLAAIAVGLNLLTVARRLRRPHAALRRPRRLAARRPQLRRRDRRR